MLKKCALSVSCGSSSIVELSRGVETLHNVSTYHEPMWHLDAKFVSGQWHEKASMHTAAGHGHFLETKNSSYNCPYAPTDNKVNAIYDSIQGMRVLCFTLVKNI